MARKNRPRPITLTDTAATTGRVLNPVGTYASRPQTAGYGQLGRYGSGLPVFGEAGGGLGLSQPSFTQVLTGNYNVAKTLPSNAQGLMAVSGSNEPYRGQPPSIQFPTLENAFISGGGAQKVLPSLVRNPLVGFRLSGGTGGSGFAPEGEGVAQNPIAAFPNAVTGGITPYRPPYYRTPIPPTIEGEEQANIQSGYVATPNVRTSARTSTAATPLAMATRISLMTPEERDAFLASIPPTQRDAIERTVTGGQNQYGNITGVQNIGGQDLIKTESGVRLDMQGNEVWNPKTATTDVYGGEFVQEGAKKWVRVNGRLVRAEAREGRWRIPPRGGRRGGGGGGSVSVPEITQTTTGSTGSYGLVTFSTGTG